MHYFEVQLQMYIPNFEEIIIYWSLKTILVMVDGPNDARTWFPIVYTCISLLK